MPESAGVDMDTLKAQAELQTVMAEANKIAAEPRRLGEETIRINAEMAKDYAQSRQYEAEARRLDRQTLLLPVTASAAVATTVTTLLGLYS